MQFETFLPQSQYYFGPNFITLDQIYLLELRQISEATYQPILAIRNSPMVSMFDYANAVDIFSSSNYGDGWA